MSLRRGLFLCQTTSKEDHPLTTYVTNAKKNKQGENLKNNLFHFISSWLNSPFTCVFLSWKDHLVSPWKSKGHFWAVLCCILQWHQKYHLQFVLLLQLIFPLEGSSQNGTIVVEEFGKGLAVVLTSVSLMSVVKLLFYSISNSLTHMVLHIRTLREDRSSRQ